MYSHGTKLLQYSSTVIFNGTLLSLQGVLFGQHLVTTMAFSHFLFFTYWCCSSWKFLHKTFDRMVAIQRGGKTDRYWTLAHTRHIDGQCRCLWNTTSNYPTDFWNTRQEGLQLTNQANCYAGISKMQENMTPVYLSVVEAVSAVIINVSSPLA